MDSCCGVMPTFKNNACAYMPPVVKKLTLRQNKKGQWQVKINGEGKWVDANYNKETKTITYLS